VRLSAIVLAAGKGTRMAGDLAKVLHPANGRPLVSWVLDALSMAEPDEIVVVVGYQAADVTAALPPEVATALQAEQLGTGHATEVGLEVLSPGPGTIVVLPGDMPLLRPGTLRALVDLHVSDHNAATVLTAFVDDPTGYGRIIRRVNRVAAVVEERDADEKQRLVREVNTSVYAFDRALLEATLGQVGTNNEQGERYLTDVIGLLAQDGQRVGALVTDAVEGMGVNDDVQLAAVSARLADRAAGS
jgi:bifunctional UDP-N-acetylglucosamine pyrophosphorylase/glucosamine-1-phosphate N-acetyltransferase